MRIIKKGALQKEWSEQVKCKKCGSELEISKEDIQYCAVAFLRYAFKVECPCCGKWFEVDIPDHIKDHARDEARHLSNMAGG